MIARSLDHGDTWETVMGFKSQVFKKTNVEIDGNLKVNGELNGARFAQIDSLASVVSQMQGSFQNGFSGDLYTRDTLYQRFGQLWSGLIANGFAGSDILAIAFGNGVFVSCGGSGKIETSSDFGATWTVRANNFAAVNLDAVVFINGVFIVAAANGTISRSTDNGATWSALIANPFATAVRAIQTLVGGNGVVIAGGQGTGGLTGGLSRSTDLGVTWSAYIADPFAEAQSIIGMGFGSGVFVIGNGNAKMARSLDSGLTWTVVTNPFVAGGAVWGIAFGSGSFVAVGDARSIARSVDLGLTWGSLISNPLPNAAIRSISYNFGVFNIIGAFSQTGSSKDNGVTWTVSSNPFSAAVSALAIASSSQTTPGTGNLVAVGTAGSIATAGWNPVPLNPPGSLFSAPLPQKAAGVGQCIWVVGASGAAISTPAGGTWAILIMVYQNAATGTWTLTGGVAPALSDFLAGGTQILAAAVGYYAIAKVFRIA
jgi:photosystem II stability/assembly factor-like uncharacterized protein